jgi:hypothetical protein
MAPNNAKCRSARQSDGLLFIAAMLREDRKSSR